MVKPTLTDLNPVKLHYYPFIISLDRCDVSCSTFEDPFGSICVPNKMEEINLKAFNKIKGVDESNTLKKHISCECRCNFDSRECYSRQKMENDRSVKIQ